jgi:cytochrome c biogenesis protein CcdA/thiol-disulfide isomerase/thioredoxin
MILFILAFLGGILTIVSPCVLPVLPFVFARAGQSFRKSGLPLLAGMAFTFAALASVAAVGGAWIVRANQYGRTAALVVLALFGLTLLLPAFADQLSRPFVQLGGRLANEPNSSEEPGILRSVLLGVATGLLWAPCAGPILGLVLTGSAIQGANGGSALLLLAYACGAALSLAVALLAGGRVFSALKRSLGAEVWIRRVLGVAVLVSVAAIAFGLDRGVLTQLSVGTTGTIEQFLIDRFHPGKEAATATGAAAPLPTAGDFSGAVAWLNSPALHLDALKGHVVLVDFWTYSCINCLRTIPYLKAWAEQYKENGLIVIGVHSPEFAFEKDPDNVRQALRELNITYPVPLDNDFKIWKTFHNAYWPGEYLIDGTGLVRHRQYGEGKYDESEREIRTLLQEANAEMPLKDFAKVSGTGALAPPNKNIQSFETYVGYDRADEDFVSDGGLRHDVTYRYSVPTDLDLNDWALSGSWTDLLQAARLDAAPGKIVYRFHARDLHLVLGPGPEGKPIRFRVSIDGKPPGADHGVDTNAQGEGQITEHRLYQLIRQKSAVEDRTFQIEFLDPGALAFAFTFG